MSTALVVKEVALDISLLLFTVHACPTRPSLIFYFFRTSVMNVATVQFRYVYCPTEVFNLMRLHRWEYNS